MSPLVSTLAGAALRPYGFTLPSGSAESSMELISTAYGNGSSTSITFSSIPSTFKHLQIRATVNLVGSSPSNLLLMQLNSDTGANYSWHQLIAANSSVTSSSGTSQNFIRLGYPGYNTNDFSAMVCDIFDYANTTTAKTTRTMMGVVPSSNDKIQLMSGRRGSTEAISTIKLYSSLSTAIASGTRFSLYGVA